MTKIVYCYVVADLLHTGHLLFLENAKALGDKLIVGVLTEAAVMEKKSKPTLSFEERLRLVQSLKCVDCAVTQHTYSPIENLKAIKPDIHIESSSHTDKDLEEINKVCKLYNIKVVKMPYYSEQSSTKIKEDIKNESSKKCNF